MNSAENFLNENEDAIDIVKEINYYIFFGHCFYYQYFF